MSISSGVLTPNKLWGTINEIQSKLDLTDDHLSQILNITSEQFILRREKGSDLPAMSLFLLADELALNFEDLIQKNFDFDLLRKNYSHDFDALPASYLRCAFSRIFTLNNILKQAEIHGKAKEVLRAIQLNRSHLNSEYASISITVIEKAINKVSRYFTKEDYDEMGTRNMMKNRDNFFGKTLLATNTYQELYEALFDRLVVVLDTNFIYQVVKSTPEYLIVNWVPNPELVEELKTSNFTTQAMTQFRQCSAEGAALYIGQQKSTLTNLKSLDRGDLYYQWRVDFPHSSSLKPLLNQ